VAVSGTKAYVAGLGGLQIIDVSNPANPVRLGYCTSGYGQAVTVSGTVAYVAADSAGLQIIDVSNAANPVRLGTCATSGRARGVAVVGTLAYVAAGTAGLEIIDVSNPTNPVRLGGNDTSGRAMGVAVAGNRIYLADFEGGLKVFCTLPNMQQMMRVTDGTLGTPYTIEAANSLTAPVAWTPFFTTNPPALPFEFTDCEVHCATHPQKFYRVRQP
jgi:hypothetical protein